MSKVVISGGVESQLPEVLALWPKDWTLDASMTLDLGLSLREGKSFVATDAESGRVIGFLRYSDRLAPGSLYIQQVLIAPEQQRSGLGSALVRQVVLLASQVGARQVLVDTPEGSPAAKRLAMMGFHPIGSVQGFFSPNFTSVIHALRPR